MKIRQIAAIHPLFERGPVAESDAFHRPNPTDPFQLMGVKAALDFGRFSPSLRAVACSLWGTYLPKSAASHT